MYSYVTVGEFVAFLIGWNLILEYMIGSAAGASAISSCFDALVDHKIKFYLEENIGTVIGTSYGTKNDLKKYIHPLPSSPKQDDLRFY